MTKTIIKGDDVINFAVIRPTDSNFAPTKLEVYIGDITKTYEQPVFPLSIDLTRYETEQLAYINKIYIATFNQDIKTTYIGYGVVNSTIAPLTTDGGNDSLNIELVQNEMVEPDTYILSSAGGGGSGGTSFHDLLQNRDLPNQHPVSSITGLQAILDDIYKKLDGYVPPEPPVEGEPSFAITDGDLIMTYEGTPEFEIQGTDLIYTYADGTTPKNYSIDSNGDLILTT